jgi:hypothetical protein
MNEFANLDALKQSFGGGQVKFDETIVVNDVEYRQIKSTEHSVLDMILKGYKALVVYSVRKNEENVEKAKAAEMKDWIVFVWAFNNKLQMVPSTVRFDTPARFGGRKVTEGFKEIDQSRIIPDIVKVMITDLPTGAELTGKVDTGASICSLHAEDIEIDRGNGKVSFMCPELSENRFTMPLADQQAVRVPSSEKTEYRPVVKMNIKIADKMLKDVSINLNDRGHMDHPFLVGQNALEAGNFIIDPNIIKEELDTDEIVSLLAEELRLETMEEEPLITKEAAAQLFDMLEDSQMTLRDLIRVLQTEAIERLDGLDY